MQLICTFPGLVCKIRMVGWQKILQEIIVFKVFKSGDDIDMVSHMAD